MKVAVIGTGYVGLVSGTCFSDIGINVTCMDIDEKKIEDLNKGVVSIYEPGLQTMVQRNMEKGRLNFTTDLNEALDNSQVVFIAVGTPSDIDGSADLQFVKKVAKDIGQTMKHYLLVVTKSTVPVGTSEKVREIIQEELSFRGASIDFDVASNPEFLKEGDAVNDFMRPDRIVAGVNNERSADIMKKLYRPFITNGHPLILMDITSSELTKYAANAMLATKISFMNDLANLSEKLGADINMIRKGIGSDSRIGNKFINPGIGYGGSCFPKDVKAIIRTAEEIGYDLKVLKAVEEVNSRQKLVLFEKIVSHFNHDISNKNFAVWGLSFKPQTDDVRESPSLVIIDHLLKEGAKVFAYDPAAINEAKLKFKDQITYTSNQYEALNNADALIIPTEWSDFRSPDFDLMKTLMKEPVIFDGRNIFDVQNIQSKGFVYYCIGLDTTS